MMLTGATPTQYYNLASMKTYNEGLENEVIQTEFGTTKVHMNLNSLDRPTVELPSSEKHELSYKDELDTAKTEIQEDLNELEQTINETINTKLEEVNQTIQQLDNEKIDKTFTNNLVNTLTYTGPQNTDLLKLNKQDINPNDNTTSSSTFTIRSSDNTLIAKPIMSGEQVVGIDLATNLDVDVHYFITSETLNTTIAAENTIQISSLTDTTADNIEVKDIVSDTEGTWARVQEVDTEGGTVKCVTFAKHAQAVWGTIKGNIEDQQDLKTKLDSKLDTTPNNKVIQTGNVGQEGSAGATISFNEYDYGTKTNTTKVFAISNNPQDKSITVLSQLQDSDPNKVETVFSVNSEEVVFDALETGITSTKLSPAVRELKGLIDDTNTEVTKLKQNKVDKAMQELVQGLEASTFNKQTGELTINYDAFDVTTNGTTKKSIVISDMIKQSDLDNKINKTNIDTVVTDTDITVTNQEGVIGLTLNKSYVNVSDNGEASEPTFIPMISSDESVTIQTGSNNLNFTVNKLDNATYQDKPLSEVIGTVKTYTKNTQYTQGSLVVCPNSTTMAYLGYVVNTFTSDNTQATIIGAFEADVNAGKILRIGIPNEVESE